MNKPLIITLLILIFTSCGSDRNKHKPSLAETKNNLIKANQFLVEKDQELIREYIKQNNIDSIKENGAGLYYKIWGVPSGSEIKKNNIVEYRFKLYLLDGTLCYQTEGNETKKFRVGSGRVESGLEQAVLLMKPGQSGIFILPPHLAHGLMGDNDKIPPRTIIVYNIEMLGVQR